LIGITMKKSALAAVALLGVSAVSGAAVLPGAATADSKAKTMRFVLHQKTSHSLGRFDFAGTDVVKRADKVIGYDAITGHYYPATNSVIVMVSFALKDGIITSRVSSSAAEPNHYDGPIISGTGKYKGIDGTISAHSPSQRSKKTFVTLKFTL
jgi:hypothetical protein